MFNFLTFFLVFLLLENSVYSEGISYLKIKKIVWKLIYQFHLSISEDECGLSFKNNNLKIVGGTEAEPNSWPASVFIVFSYRKYIIIDGNYTIQEFDSVCGGNTKKNEFRFLT